MRRGGLFSFHLAIGNHSLISPFDVRLAIGWPTGHLRAFPQNRAALSATSNTVVRARLRLRQHACLLRRRARTTDGGGGGGGDAPRFTRCARASCRRAGVKLQTTAVTDVRMSGAG